MSVKTSTTVENNVFTYSSKDLIETPLKWSDQEKKVTSFDKLLIKAWTEAEKHDILKYKLSDCAFKVLSEEGDSSDISYVAQLNPQRGFNRRKREVFNNMNEKFSPGHFNFTKIKQNEIIMKIQPGEGTASAVDITHSIADHKNDHVVAVNISPIDKCHVLLVPSCSSCQPQKLTVASLLLAFDFAQLSSNPGFRVGFNSVHAWASVNHLHYHAMFCNYKLFIDDLDSHSHVNKHCFLVEENFMISGFVFHIPIVKRKRIEVAEQIVTITDLFHKKEIPYNLAITRSTKSNLGTRAFIWPRKSTKNLEPSSCFDVACVEVGGQFPVKTESEFTSLSFTKARNVLREAGLDRDDFVRLVDEIKQL